MLYRERAKHLQQGQYANISFSVKVESSGKATVIITHTEPLKMILIDEDGSETPLILDFKKREVSSSLNQGKERMIRMMFEDALSRKEILDYFKDLNEDEIALIEELFKEDK